MYLTREQIQATRGLTSRQAARVLGVGKSSVNTYRNYYASNEPSTEFLENAKILTIDIESKPLKFYGWGPRNDWVSPTMMIEEGGMICFAAKWLGDDEVLFYSEYEHGIEATVQAAHSLLSEADIVVTYNGDRYDFKRLNNEFLKRNMAPPKPYRSIDLFKTNRAKFDLPYKKLDILAQHMGVGQKAETGGFDLWLRCMAGDAEAWATMKEYNIQDVRLTENVYVRLLPWLNNIPHAGMFVTDGACPYCGSPHVKDTGETTATHVQRYPLLQCDNCQGWSRGNKPVQDSLTTRKT